MEKENNPYNLSAAALKAMERFGPGYVSNSSPANLPEPLPLPGTDWELWTHMPKATLTEAVAVSLGIDPSAIKPGSGYVEPGKEFDRRLKLACAYVSHDGQLKSLDLLHPMHLFGGPATATVSLPEFAKWVLSMGWTLPEQFPRFKATPPQPQPVRLSTVPVTPTMLQATVQSIVKSKLQKLKPTPATDTAPEQSIAMPAPVVTVSDVEPIKAALGWRLKTSIKRAPGYRWPLYQVLKAALIAGEPCPKPRDVLEAWKKSPPPDVQVMPDGVKYNDGLGNPQEADLKAIQQAIKGLLES